MRKIVKIVFSIYFIISTNSSFAQTQEEVEQYIDKYKRLAMEEQIRSGVPAAITLAQGIHEATAGKSELATEANNHFGIKCKSTWTGMTYLHDDDAKQECFRKYSSAEQSYIDHSDFLRANNRYAFLFDLDVTDYKGWASGLKRAGYATNPAYVKRLTDAVEKYNLQEYTTQAQNKKFEIVGEVVPVNDKKNIVETKKEIEKPTEKLVEEAPTNYYKGLKGFYAKKGDMLLQKAVEYNIRYARLLQINDLDDAPLPADMFIFTEKKRKVGTVEFHTVQKDENMFLIAQKEAMFLDNLYNFNNLLDGQEPEIGEQLSLIYKTSTTPKIKAKFLNSLPTNKEETFVTTSEKVRKVVKEEVAKPILIAQEVKNEIVLEKPVDEIKKEVLAVEVTPIEISKAEKQNEEKADVLSTEELNKLNEIKEEFKKAEKKEITKIEEPIKEEVTTKIVIDNSSPIKDIEKAKRVEELLSKEKKVEKDVITKVVEVKEETPKPIEIIEIAKEQVKEIPVVKKEKLLAPKRTYNEKNVDEDIKSLKRKFDEAVYMPLPERVKEIPKAEIPKKEIPNSKTNAQKTDDKNKVKQTSTGIVRELKKEEPKKEIPNKEIPNSKTKQPITDAKKIEKAPKEITKKEIANTKLQKEVTKKDDKKKVEAKSKEKVDKKATDSKDKKKGVVKKDEKKKTDSKIKEASKTKKK